MNKEIETLTRWQDTTIEMLNKKIEAQDKIINTQALEIAHLHLQLDQALKIAKELLIKIDKAIEYIKNKKQFQQGCDTYQIIDWNYVLKILGDKENENK